MASPCRKGTTFATGTRGGLPPALAGQAHASAKARMQLNPWASRTTERVETPSRCPGAASSWRRSPGQRLSTRLLPQRPGARKCLRPTESDDRQGRPGTTSGASEPGEAVVEVSLTLTRAAVQATADQRCGSRSATATRRSLRCGTSGSTRPSRRRRRPPRDWRCFQSSVRCFAVGLILGAMLATTDVNRRGRERG